jgi:hypothetical protein
MRGGDSARKALVLDRVGVGGLVRALSDEVRTNHSQRGRQGYAQATDHRNRATDHDGPTVNGAQTSCDLRSQHAGQPDVQTARLRASTEI